MEKIVLKNNMDLYDLDMDKFKTISLTLHIYRPMGTEAADNALLAGVLKSGCEKYPSKMEIAKRLEWLYGASLLSGISKKGETQVLTMMVTAPCGQYTGEKMGKALAEFLYEIVFRPKIINQGFEEGTVMVEKENLKNRIQALLNDKKEYATERCIAEMCQGEPFGLYELGTVEEVDRITPESLKQHYEKVLRESKMDLFVSGKCEIGEIQKVFDGVTVMGEPPKPPAAQAVKELRTVEEQMNISQGKLVVGMRADCQPVGQEYYDLLLFISVYGSGTHSKLFNNVRERLSLAYYAYSRLYRQKSIILVGTGIEFEKYGQTKEEIFRQLEEMKLGNITEFEIEAAKKSLVNSYRSLSDTPVSLTDFYIGQLLCGAKESVEGAIENIQKVTKEGIVKAANKVKPDTVYFLKGVQA